MIRRLDRLGQAFFILEQGCHPINNPINHTRRRAVGDDGPAMENSFAPTPRMKPSAAVNIGHSDFAKIFTLNQRCGIM